MRNTFTIPQNIFVYGYSHGGSSFEQFMCLDTTIVYLFFKKKIKSKKNQKEEKKSKREKKEKKNREKEKERGDIHNQSINHWCLTYLSCISEELYG